MALSKIVRLSRFRSSSSNRTFPWSKRFDSRISLSFTSTR